MTTIARNFQPNKAFERGVFRGVVGTILYWSNPGLCFTGFGLSLLPIANVLRATSEKISSIWEKNKGWTSALLCICSFLSLPTTVGGLSILFGANVGTDLNIDSSAQDAVTEYKRIVKTPLSIGASAAFLEFLCQNQNLDAYTELYESVNSVRVLDLNRKRAVYQAHSSRFERIREKEMDRIAEKTAAIWTKLDQFEYKDTVRITIESLVQPILNRKEIKKNAPILNA